MSAVQNNVNPVPQQAPTVASKPVLKVPAKPAPVVDPNMLTITVSITKEDFLKSTLYTGSTPLKVVAKQSEETKWLMFKQHMKGQSKATAYALLTDKPPLLHLEPNLWHEIADTWDASLEKGDPFELELEAEKAELKEAENKRNAELARLYLADQKAKEEAKLAQANLKAVLKAKSPMGNKKMPREEWNRRQELKGKPFDDATYEKERARMDKEAEKQRERDRAKAEAKKAQAKEKKPSDDE